MPDSENGSAENVFVPSFYGRKNATDLSVQVYYFPKVKTTNTTKGDNVMSYESKLYVVDKRTFAYGEPWGNVISMFDLRAVPRISDKMRKYPKTDCFIISDDGCTEVTKDRCDEVMTEIPIPDAIKIIENAVDEEPYYRRYNPCLHLLKGFDLDDWNNLVVLHFGY